MIWHDQFFSPSNFTAITGLDVVDRLLTEPQHTTPRCSLLLPWRSSLTLGVVWTLFSKVSYLLNIPRDQHRCQPIQRNAESIGPDEPFRRPAWPGFKSEHACDAHRPYAGFFPKAEPKVEPNIKEESNIMEETTIEEESTIKEESKTMETPNIKEETKIKCEELNRA